MINCLPIIITSNWLHETLFAKQTADINMEGHTLSMWMFTRANDYCASLKYLICHSLFLIVQSSLILHWQTITIKLILFRTRIHGTEYQVPGTSSSGTCFRISVDFICCVGYTTGRLWGPRVGEQGTRIPLHLVLRSPKDHWRVHFVDKETTYILDARVLFFVRIHTVTTTYST